MDLKLQQYINGKWVGANSGRMRTIINPYNQEIIATVPEGDQACHPRWSADRLQTEARRALRDARRYNPAPDPIAGSRTGIRHPIARPSATACSSGNRWNRCRWSGTAPGRDSDAQAPEPRCRDPRTAGRHPRPGRAGIPAPPGYASAAAVRSGRPAP